jgi:hypothetical protein
MSRAEAGDLVSVIVTAPGAGRAGQPAWAEAGTGLPNIVQITAVWSALAVAAIFGSDPNSAQDSVDTRRVAVRLPVRSVTLAVR